MPPSAERLVRSRGPRRASRRIASDSRLRRSEATAAKPISARSIGPTVYRKDIVELSGDYLADYDVERICIELTPDERELYESERAHLPRLSSRARHPHVRARRGGASSSCSLRAARRADARWPRYRTQRKLAFAASAKLDYLEHLLVRCTARDRAILFTQDNATAYEVSRRFLVPAITHQTKVKERSHLLAGLAAGEYGAIVTSKVLNEGVDVPDGERGGRCLGQRIGA